MRILLSIVGSPLAVTTEPSDYGGNEMLPLIRHLAKEHEVLYYGRTIGEAEFDIVEPVMLPRDATDVSPWLAAEEVVEAWKPEIYLQMAGPKFSSSVPGWTNGNPSDASIRYSGPILHLTERLKIPRVVMVTDPKVYPHECEMAAYDSLLPAALLSQEERVFEKTIYGRKLICSAVWSGCEYWATEGMTPRQSTGELMLAICAHSHAGKLSDERQHIWRRVLDHSLPTEIIGRGWEGRPEWVGTVPTFADVMDFLNRGLYCPMLPQYTGFNSTKVRLAALAGNCPLLYGRGEKWTYDIDARVLPLDHPARIDAPLPEVIARVEQYGRERVISEVLKATEPDWSLLNRFIAGERGPAFGGYFDQHSNH